MRPSMSVDSGTLGDRELWVLQRLRQDGRATAASIVTLKILADSGTHLTVAEVHREMLQTLSTVNKSTVYRTVERLERLGLIHRLDVAGEAQYGSADHAHHHAVCTRCGQVSELDRSAASRALSVLEAVTSLRPDRASGLTLRGVCAGCRVGPQRD